MDAMSSEAPQRPLQLTDEHRPEGAGRHNNRLFLVALVAFAFGVFLHAWVVITILDNDSSKTQTGEVPPATELQPPPEPATLTDRRNCAEIRGTDYRSTSERDFYLANCLTTTGLAPSTVAVRPYRATLRPLPARGTFGLPTSRRP
jgi:hypothetical protein